MDTTLLWISPLTEGGLATDETAVGSRKVFEKEGGDDCGDDLQDSIDSWLSFDVKES